MNKSEVPAPKEIEVHKNWRYISALSAATGEIVLTGVKRAIVTTEKRIPKGKKI